MDVKKQSQEKKNSKLLLKLILQNWVGFSFIVLSSVVFGIFDLSNPVKKYKTFVKYEYKITPITQILKCEKIKSGCNQLQSSREIENILNRNSEHSSPEIKGEFQPLENWTFTPNFFYKVSSIDKKDIESELNKVNQLFKEIRFKFNKKNRDFISFFDYLDDLKVYNDIEYDLYEKKLITEDESFSKENIQQKLDQAFIFKNNILQIKFIKNYLANKKNSVIEFEKANIVPYRVNPFLKLLMYVSSGILLSVALINIKYNLSKDI